MKAMKENNVINDPNAIFGDIRITKTGELRTSAEAAAKVSRKVTFEVSYKGAIVKDTLAGKTRDVIVPLQNGARDLPQEEFDAWLEQWKQEDGSYVVSVHANDSFGKEFFSAPPTKEEIMARQEADFVRMDKLDQLQQLKKYLSMAGLDTPDVERQIAEAKAEAEAKATVETSN